MKFSVALTILAGVATALPAAVPGHVPTAATLPVQATLRMAPRQQGGASNPQPTPAAANEKANQGDSSPQVIAGATVQGVIRSTTILGPVTLPVIYQFPPVSHPQANEKPQPAPAPTPAPPPPPPTPQTNASTQPNKQLDEKKKSEYPLGMSTGALMAIIWGLAGFLIILVLLIAWCQLRLLKKKFPKPSTYHEPPPSKSRVTLIPRGDGDAEVAAHPPAYTRNSLEVAPRYGEHGTDELHPEHKHVGSAGAQGTRSRMDALRTRVQVEDVPQSPDVDSHTPGSQGAWGWVSGNSSKHGSNNSGSRAEGHERKRSAGNSSWRSLDSSLRRDDPVTSPVDTASRSPETKPDTEPSSQNTPPSKASMFERRPWTKPKRYQAP